MYWAGKSRNRLAISIKKKKEINTGDRYAQETERNTMKQNKTDDEFRVRNKTKRIVLSSGHELETKTNLSPHEQLNLRPSDTALRCSMPQSNRDTIEE